MTPVVPLIEAHDLHHSFGAVTVLQGVSISVHAGEMTAIIGPNGSGKSTLLRIVGRLLRPHQGVVRFDSRDAWSIPPREFARRVAFLPQAPEAPADLTVGELVARGRHPYRGLLGGSSERDREAVERALVLAGVEVLRHRTVSTLSGGERQRAWVALALAQEPDVLLLDEPTTYLDIGHQVELLSLLAGLNEEQGLTVLMVMHDLPQAAHYAKRLVAVRAGEVVADGPPREVLTESQVEAIFGVAVRVYRDPESGVPVVAPVGR
ncbi:MAG: ABC transporter ATP-binding protein [Dehalococcoidia bacterium]|nr:MAG: ABC transporter ATP-binding protein [Dehalococcoidia bacterium]